MSKTHTVIRQNWEESERGWGVRPDGYTLSLTEEDRKKYVEYYNKKYNNESSVPDCYTRTSGEPKLMDVDTETFNKIKKSEHKTIWP